VLFHVNFCLAGSLKLQETSRGERKNNEYFGHECLFFKEGILQYVGIVNELSIFIEMVFENIILVVFKNIFLFRNISK